MLSPRNTPTEIIAALGLASPLLVLAATLIGAFTLSPSTTALAVGSAGPLSLDSTLSHKRGVLLASAANQRPPRPQVSNQTAIAGRSFTYQVPEVIDPDGDSLTYNVSLGAGFNPLPSWLRFDPDTRTFTGRQRASHIGEYTIRVAVDDGSLESWANFMLTVVEAPPNQPPIAPSLTDQTAVEDKLFSYVAPAFTDPDEDTLTYAAGLSNGSSLPTWLTFNPTTRTFSGTPLEPDTPATLTIQVTAGDGTQSTGATFALAVQEVNDPPAAPSIPPQTAIEGAPFSYQAPAFTDPEGNTLTYTAALDGGGDLPSWLAFDADTRTFSGTALGRRHSGYPHYPHHCHRRGALCLRHIHPLGAERQPTPAQAPGDGPDRLRGPRLHLPDAGGHRPRRRHPHIQRFSGRGLQPAAIVAQLRPGHPYIHRQAARVPHRRVHHPSRSPRWLARKLGRLHADGYRADQPGRRQPQQSQNRPQARTRLSPTLCRHSPTRKATRSPTRLHSTTTAPFRRGSPSIQQLAPSAAHPWNPTPRRR